MKTWVEDRDSLFTYLEMINDLYDTDFQWHWTGTGDEADVEVFSPLTGLSVVAKLPETQETMERMLQLWGYK